MEDLNMAKRKMSIADFKDYKKRGQKFAYVTAYDYTMASIVNESDCEVILVGDSLAMVMLGRKTTVYDSPHQASRFRRSKHLCRR